MKRHARVLSWLGVASLVLVGCGDDSARDGGVGGDAATSSDGSAGAGAPTSPGSTSSGGAGGSTGTSSSPTSGASSGGSSAQSSGAGGGPPTPCGGFPTFEDGLAPTSEVHVANGGDDGSGDGSAGAPFASLDRALDAAAPGASIVLHAGTYPGGAYAAGLAGTADAPIWIGGAAGEARPVIEGGDVGMQLSGARYVILHDLEVRGTNFDGINIDDGGDYGNEDAARFIVVRDLAIHDIGDGGNNDCLKLSGVNDFSVLRVAIARCGAGGMAGSGIDHVGCHRGLVANSSFDEMSGNGVQCKGGSADIDIVANTFVDGGERAVNMGGSTGFEFFRPPLEEGAPNAEATDIRVISNVFVRGQSAAAFVGCVGCVAAHNTIVDPRHWVFRVLQETVSGGGYAFLPAANGRVVNNVVHFTDAAVTEHVNVGGGTDAGTFTFENNLWYATDAPGASAPILPVAESGGIVGTPAGFVDEAGGDYHLATGSPAIGAGASVEGAYGDRDGECWLAPPSIGAYEGGMP